MAEVNNIGCHSYQNGVFNILDTHFTTLHCYASTIELEEAKLEFRKQNVQNISLRVELAH
jgi:hypothetical protein